MWSHVPHRVVRTDTGPIGEVGADHCNPIHAGNRDDGGQDQRPLWFLGIERALFRPVLITTKMDRCDTRHCTMLALRLNRLCDPSLFLAARGKNGETFTRHPHFACAGFFL